MEFYDHAYSKFKTGRKNVTNFKIMSLDLHLWRKINK